MSAAAPALPPPPTPIITLPISPHGLGYCAGCKRGAELTHAIHWPDGSTEEFCAQCAVGGA